MNTIKTIVVVATLLAVGYGAHIVLKQQPISDRFAAAEGVWQDLQQTTPSLDLDAAAASRPQITLPELTQTPLRSIRSDGSSLPAAADVSATAELPANAGHRSTAPATPSGTVQPQLLADLRRHSSNRSGSHANDPSELLPVAPAEPAGVQQAAAALPDASSPGLATRAQHNAPVENRQASAATPIPGYIAPDVLPAAPAPSGAVAPFEQTWSAAEAQLSAGRYAEALFLLSAHYRDQQLSASQRDRLVTLLDQLAGSVIYSPDYHLESPQVVQPGQPLMAMASTYGVTAAFLARVNGLSPSAAHPPGTRIKVVRGPFRAEVSLADRELTLFLDKYYAGRFNCSIGRDLPAQVQEMTVVRVASARPYVDSRTGEQIPPGAPENPYGNHWIELFAATMPGATLGIHSFGSTIDASDTRGCIGVRPEEADDLATILSPGSRVTVVP